MAAPNRIRVPKHGLNVREARNVREKDLKLKADAVIVGSGAGGAVMAFELARAGKKVIVLEAGPYVPSAEFTEKPAESIEQLYQDRGSQTNAKGDMLVLQGACVGGSTVVNGAVAFRTPDSVLDTWVHEHGLKNLSAAALRKHFEKIEKRLSIHTNLPHEIDQNSRTIEAGCKKLGLSIKPVARNIKNCALTGFCLTGCASDRKQSMLVTYLPWATACGAQIFADTKATRVLRKGGRAAGVAAEVIDPGSKEIVARMRVDAPVVVVAAGAVQSPLLLQKSDLANASGMVGRNFACHPSLLIIGEFPDAVYGWKGALSSSYIDDYADKARGGFIFVTNMVGPMELALAVGTGLGRDHLEFMRNAKNMAGLTSFMHDQNHGRVYWKDGVKTIDYDLHKKDRAAVRKALKTAARIYFAAGANQVHLPTLQRTVIRKKQDINPVIDRLTLETSTLYFTSYHPQGTCRMGTDPKKSVVNPYGESHDVPGLFVADASIFPDTTMVNPQHTIYALSSYIAEHIIKNSEKYFVGKGG